MSQGRSHQNLSGQDNGYAVLQVQPNPDLPLIRAQAFPKPGDEARYLGS